MMAMTIKACGLLIILTLAYILVFIIRKLNKPVIEELRNPSAEMIDFAGQDNLDEFQKRALLSKYKQTLILAGAGAGKTAILTKRVILFNKFLKVPISNMLVMAFNKGAAGEVAQRVADATGDWPDELKDNIRTIHSFAYKLAKEENPMLEVMSSDKEVKNFVKQVVVEFRQGKESHLYAEKLIDLFGNKEPTERKNKKEKVPEPGKEIRCSDGTMVRSKAEQRIVEKLIQNNIKYEYEPMTTWADRYFEPDFFFPDYGVYAEYWGMMYHEDPGIKERYCKQMEWKKEQFKKYKFYLIDVKPFVNASGQSPEDYLVSRLKMMKPGQFEGMHEHRLEKIFNTLEDHMVDLIISILDISIAYGKKIKDLVPGAEPFIKAILKFIIPICENLEQKMNQKNKTTFTKMLYLALRRLRRDKQLIATLRERYKCIFVDEVQDLQPLTRQFIRLLTGKDQNLFAIGDDYQSIYSFTGCDPSFIVKFEHYFPEARVLPLKFNYRCHPNIVKISNTIIRNNRNQRFKFVEGKLQKGQTESDKVLTVVTVSDDAKSKELLAEFLLSRIPERENIQFLARYNESIPPIEPFMSFINQKFQRRNYKFLTIHKSKGLQADNVVLLGCVNNPDGQYCLPAVDNVHRLKDRVLRLCRDNKFNLIEEETRLFYVAVTRAKRRVFIITADKMESEFTSNRYLDKEFINRISLI